MATQPSPSLLLDKKDIVLVKPSKPIPHDTLSLSTIDNNPTLELLCQTLYVYRPNSTSADPVCVLKEALSKLLLHYYPLAGKLKRNTDDGQLRITFNGDTVGVPFLGATASCNLSSLAYFDGVDVETAKQFVFDYPADDDGYHPLVLQVTRFQCGGFTVGMGLSHSVCDGFGAAQLFGALAELASGRSEPSVKPVWERDRLAGKLTGNPLLLRPPMDKASSTTSPYLPTEDLLHQCFYVSSESLSRLKKSTEETESFTVVEVLGAYVWRARFKALQMNPDGKTLFCLTVGIRNRYPLPAGYYGNAFVGANVVLTGRELVEGPLGGVAGMIRERKRRACEAEHIREQLDLLELLRVGVKEVEGGGGGAAMVLTDWRQLGLVEQVDFGWKDAVNVIPLPWNMFGYVDLCIFMPPCALDPSTKGGVRVLVCLPKLAMHKFSQEMDVLHSV